MESNKNHPNNVQKDKSNESKNFSYRYPTSEKNIILDEGGQFLIFKMREKPEVFSAKNEGGKSRSGSGEKIIKLFIPQGSLNYTRSFEYTPEDESAFKALGTSALDLASGRKDLNQSVKNSLNNLGIRGIMATAQEFVPGINQVVGAAGYAFNPNIEFYFKNQGFRTFSFTFPFLPKNETEAAGVKKIVTAFEKYSLPVIESKYLFKYPKTWEISTDGPVGFSTKECVIENFTVTYGADNGYTTFKDGQPVMTTMKIDFQEIEQWGQDDIKLEG